MGAGQLCGGFRRRGDAMAGRGGSRRRGRFHTYESGIVQIARDNNKVLALASTKTKPSGATLDDFRTLHTKVNKATLNGRLSGTCSPCSIPSATVPCPTKSPPTKSKPASGPLLRYALLRQSRHSRSFFLASTFLSGVPWPKSKCESRCAGGAGWASTFASSKMRKVNQP